MRRRRATRNAHNSCRFSTSGPSHDGPDITAVSLTSHRRAHMLFNVVLHITTVTPERRVSRACRRGQCRTGTRGHFGSRQARMPPCVASGPEDKCTSRALSDATRKRRKALDARRALVSTEEARRLLALFPSWERKGVAVVTCPCSFRSLNRFWRAPRGRARGNTLAVQFAL